MASMDQPPTNMSASKPKPAQAVPKETLDKLAERLKELVGEDFEMPRDQLVNEDGLPIIEFTEPVTQSRDRNFRIPSPPLLKPLPQTEAERVVRRKEIEAFFAALEEEERQEEKKDDREKESEFMRVILEAKENAEEARTGENTRRNAGFLGKRVSDGGQSGESDENAKASPNASSPTPKRNKVVKFADVVDEEKETTSTQTWGDVQQGRLRKPLGMKSGGDIMKLEIVEKFPSTSKPRVVDSDDEDDGDSDDEDDGDPSSGEGGGEGERNQIEIEDALHQREIALRYHEMRQSLGAGPRGGALGGFVDPETNDEWDQEDVPLDASFGGRNPGSSRSQFNANRLSVRTLNAHLPKGLAGEFRPAILENDQLVGTEDGESDSDIGPRGRRIIEGLKRGLTVEEVMANEPSDDEGDSAPKAEVKPIKRGTALMGDVVEVQERIPKPNPQKGMPVKISKFKANRME